MKGEGLHVDIWTNKVWSERNMLASSFYRHHVKTKVDKKTQKRRGEFAQVISVYVRNVNLRRCSASRTSVHTWFRKQRSFRFFVLKCVLRVLIACAKMAAEIEID